MKKIILSLFVLIGMLAYSQNLCEECVEQNGFYCGDDPTNWTQYSPNGCVPNGPNLFYLNDGWEDCVDGSDESEAVPTTLEACSPYVEPCDTVYIIEPEYIYITDTLYIVEYETEYIVEYIDCVTNEPCGNSQIIEIMKGSFGSDIMYNLKGQVIRKPEGIYIQNGEVKYKL